MRETIFSLIQRKIPVSIIMTQVSPVAACFAASLVFSNEAYIYISLSFIQILKAGWLYHLSSF